MGIPALYGVTGRHPVPSTYRITRSFKGLLRSELRQPDFLEALPVYGAPSL